MYRAFLFARLSQQSHYYILLVFIFILPTHVFSIWGQQSILTINPSQVTSHKISQSPLPVRGCPAFFFNQLLLLP